MCRLRVDSRLMFGATVVCYIRADLYGGSTVRIEDYGMGDMSLLHSIRRGCCVEGPEVAGFHQSMWGIAGSDPIKSHGSVGPLAADGG